MLVRIVKMSFNNTLIDRFLNLFETHKYDIRSYPGCAYLELYQDKEQKNIFFTYSYWKSEVELNNYRQSELFKEVWSETKKLFNDKPLAWSVNKVVSLP